MRNWFRRQVLFCLWVGLCSIGFCGGRSSLALCLEDELARQVFWAADHGLFHRTLAYAEDYLRRFPRGQSVARVRFSKAQALYFLRRPQESLQTLSFPLEQVPETLRSSWLELELRALAACGQWELVPKVAEEILAGAGSKEQKERARYILAWAKGLGGQGEEAQRELERFCSGKAPWAAKALLLSAKLALRQGQLQTAQTTLQKLLSTCPESPETGEAFFWLGELAVRRGNYGEALYDEEKFFRSPFPKDLDLEAAATATLARALALMGRTSEALDRLEKELAAPGLGQTPWGWRLAELYLRILREAPSSAERVWTWKRMAESQAPGLGLFRWLWGRISLEDPKLAASLGPEERGPQGWQRVLEEEAPSSWKAFGYYRLGLEWLGVGEEDKALAALTRAGELASASFAGYPDFVLGEVFFAKGSYGKAAQRFRQAAIEEPRIGEEATFNWLLSLAKEGKIQEFETGLQGFENRYPSSPLLDELLQQCASLYRRLGDLRGAEKALKEALRHPRMPQAAYPLRLELGDLFFEQGRYREASASYREAAKEADTAPKKEEALYKAILSDYWSGELDPRQARDTLLAWASAHPKNPYAPRALFQVGELSLSLQDLVGAEAAFGKLAADYPDHELADGALYWAAKAALDRGNGTGALSLLEKISDRSFWKSQAALLQAKIYQASGQYALALDVLQNLSARSGGETSVTGEADLRKGECFLALGRYAEAEKAFAKAAGSSELAPVRREEAFFKEALALAKEGKREEALEIWLRLLEGRIGSLEAQSFFWRVKAGIEAASLKLEDKDWEGAAAVYEALEALGGPTRDEFHRAALALRREHFLVPQPSSP